MKSEPNWSDLNRNIMEDEFDINMKYVTRYEYNFPLTPNEIAIIKIFAEFDNG